ncbi:hypothetical protein ACN9JG_06845 [Cereibacter azotoformans]|uniref:hypothetical protein n=1 Tax=Cereibacter azotoformans TaxID=43057 RepID=UPI003B20E0CC
MRIILPTPVTPAALLASNIPEDDHPAWGAAVTYARGARVVAGHGVWESVADGNTGHDPVGDALGAWWLRIGATNRWRAFDERIGGQTVGGPTITYSIRLPRTLNRIAFFNLDASSLRVTVTTPAGATIHDRTVDLVARDPVGTFWEYVFTEFAFTPNVIVAAPLPAATRELTRERTQPFPRRTALPPSRACLLTELPLRTTRHRRQGSRKAPLSLAVQAARWRKTRAGGAAHGQGCFGNCRAQGHGYLLPEWCRHSPALHLPA